MDKLVEEVGKLLVAELRRTRPNSRVIADLSRALRDLCAASGFNLTFESSVKPTG